MTEALLETAGPGTQIGLWLARLANYLALAAVAGLLVAGGHLVGGPPERLVPAARRCVRMAAVAAAVWAATGIALYGFGVSNAAARPLPQALDLALLARFAGTRFGAAVIVQAVAALLVAGLAALARDRRGAGAAFAGMVLAAAAPALWGHAATADPTVLAIAADWIHVVAAAVWVGGLASLALLVLPARSDIDVAGPSRRFSRLAGVALAAVLATGAANTVVHLGSLENLTTTTWGRLALVKLGLLVAVSVLGWRNRAVWVPRVLADPTAGEPDAPRVAFRRFALLELAVMVAAFGVAAGMTSGMPAASEAAARIQSVTTAFGDGQVNLTLDPARSGANELHVFFFGPDGAVRRVGQVRVTFRAGSQDVDARLFDAGPGHYTAPFVVLAAGVWDVEVVGLLAGEPDTPTRATASVTVR